MKIFYRFESVGMEDKEFEVVVGRSMSPRKGQADWTRLDHNQCRNCTLRTDVFSHCPAAVDLEVVVEAFNEVLACQEVTTVISLPNDRTIRRTGDAQSAVGALLGLIMASSSCPILSRMKGLAMTHLPFQTIDELILRFIGTYFLGQFLEHRDGGEPDWTLDGLKLFLYEIDQLNADFLERVAAAAREDSTLEGIQHLMSQVRDVRELLESWSQHMDLYAIPAAQAS